MLRTKIQVLGKLLFSMLLPAFSLPMLAADGSSYQAKNPGEFTVLQWNIWQEGTCVPGGYDAIVNEIVRLKPDFVTFSEVRNYNGVNFTARLVDSLKERGETYYSFKTNDSGLLSRHEIADSGAVFKKKGIHGTIHRLASEIHGRKIAVYTAHLDYLTEANYDVKGYDGSTYQEREPITTVAEALELNVKSHRDDAIAEFLPIARKDRDEGYIVILGGDFNEPSFQDWGEETKDIFDHHGLVVPWVVSSMLVEDGFKDAYRQHYPDVIAYPGFTFPSDNPAMLIGHLAWGPKADERDRIDYVWYNAESGLKVVDAWIFGPTKSIIRAQRREEISLDPFILPLDVWPTDHKAVLIKFTL